MLILNEIPVTADAVLICPVVHVCATPGSSSLATDLLKKCLWNVVFDGPYNQRNPLQHDSALVSIVSAYAID